MADQLQTIADPTLLAPLGDLERERTLVAVYTGEADEGRTRLIELVDGAEVSFGRTRAATIHVDSERVSRLHAKITRRGSILQVEDLGSRNGTRVNGSKIEGPTKLASGDQIEVGPVTVVVSITSAIAPRTSYGSTAYLEERLAAECDRGVRYQRGFALVMLHLDGAPKRVDDAMDRIGELLRPMDSIAEYGPDELAILLPEADGAGAEATAKRLQEAARASGGVEARVGIASFPAHGSQPGELVSRARSALRSARAGKRADAVTAQPEVPAAEGDVIVVDPQMQRVYALVKKVADTPMTVLIVGETGTGKEVVAEALHRSSGRRAKTYVRLNCACLPETLLESELFGHERGSFTGADRRKIGYFEAADGGTIFLDEIGEITPAVQAKLLRVLEEHKITRVGGTQEISVDVRVVCATNRDLEKEVRRGVFREDLFFRISAFAVVVPPLRDRRSEIVPLAEYFVRQAARELGQPAPALSPSARQVMERYPWPGNVRELRNAIERALVLQSGGSIEVDDLPQKLRDESTGLPPATMPLTVGGAVDVREQIADVEKASIVAALDSCNGNQTRAAQRLGLSRRALIYRMEKYGLKPPPGSGRDEPE